MHMNVLLRVKEEPHGGETWCCLFLLLGFGLSYLYCVFQGLVQMARI